MKNSKSCVNKATKDDSIVFEVLTQLRNCRPSPPLPQQSPPPPQQETLENPLPPLKRWGHKRHRTIRVQVGVIVSNAGLAARRNNVENQIRRSIRILNRLSSSKSKATASPESCQKTPSRSKRGKATSSSGSRQKTPSSSKLEKARGKVDGAKVSTPKKTHGLKIAGDNQEVEAYATVPSNSKKVKGKVEGAKVSAASKKLGLEIWEAEDNQQVEEATMPTIEECVVQHRSLSLKKKRSSQGEIPRKRFKSSKEIQILDVHKARDNQGVVETTMATVEEQMVQNESFNLEMGEIQREEFSTSKEIEVPDVREAGDDQQMVETTMATIEEHMVQNEPLNSEKMELEETMSWGETHILELSDGESQEVCSGDTVEFVATFEVTIEVDQPQPDKIDQMEEDRFILPDLNLPYVADTSP